MWYVLPLESIYVTVFWSYKMDIKFLRDFDSAQTLLYGVFGVFRFDSKLI